MTQNKQQINALASALHEQVGSWVHFATSSTAGVQYYQQYFAKSIQQPKSATLQAPAKMGWIFSEKLQHRIFLGAAGNQFSPVNEDYVSVLKSGLILTADCLGWDLTSEMRKGLPRIPIHHRESWDSVIPIDGTEGLSALGKFSQIYFYFHCLTDILVS